MGKLNGLDLFSGIGGMSVGLQEWVRPIAYCEIDKYCQGVLLSLMSTNAIYSAPIWDDIRSLPTIMFPDIDIIYGGFPCQDISVAGRGEGLEGKRSGLFFEIVRLAKEIKPKFIFLENVPAITSRGGVTVVRTLAEMGYDCRWCVISAASIGALHRRERWFLLGYAKHPGWNGSEERGSLEAPILPCAKGKDETCESEGTGSSSMLASESISNSTGQRRDEGAGKGICCGREPSQHEESPNNGSPGNEQRSTWWSVEPDVGRVADGVSQRVDKLRVLGNAVVPLQAKEAFKILMGFKS